MNDNSRLSLLLLSLIDYKNNYKIINLCPILVRSSHDTGSKYSFYLWKMNQTLLHYTLKKQFSDVTC